MKYNLARKGLSHFVFIMQEKHYASKVLRLGVRGTADRKCIRWRRQGGGFGVKCAVLQEGVGGWAWC